MQTRAAILHAPDRRFVVETLDLDPPKAGEVCVRMRAAGICRSDWHLATGATAHPMPVVAGHEGAGVVEAVGAGVERVKVGASVVLSWAPGCGRCFFCARERPALCETYTEAIWNGTLLDGTTRLRLGRQPVYHFCGLACFAEFAVVPEASVVPCPPELPPAVGALLGCAVTTGVGAVLNTAQVEAGASVAVFGVGGVGLSVVMGAAHAGADPILAIDRVAAREAEARAVGASDFLRAEGDVLGAIRQGTGGRGADYVFDTTGVPAVQEACLEAARPGGTVVLAGLAPMGSATNLPGAVITRQEKTITGSYYGTAVPERDIPRFADLYQRGRLPLDRLLTQTYRLDAINEAYADLDAGRLARGVILF